MTKKNIGTIGMRDTLIWLDMLDDLQDRPNAFGVLVSADGAFWDHDTGALHPDLLADLDERGIERESVTLVRDLSDATVEAHRLGKVISQQQAQAGAAFLQYLNEADQLDWFGHFDPNRGWVEAETYPAEISHIEMPHVSAVDVDVLESVSLDTPARCVGYIYVHVTGWMSTSDYLSGDYPEIDRDGGGIDDHYAEVSTSRRVRVEADVHLDAKRIIDEVEFSFA